MTPVNKNGSLGIEEIKQLPIEERIYTISHLTKEQREEYISKLPIIESKNTRPIIYGNLKEELASGKLVDAFEVIEGL